MNIFQRNRNQKNSVKEALDNLPVGVCFFQPAGILLLCNRQMYRLAFLLMGHDLQTLEELQEALDLLPKSACCSRICRLSDDSWWNFSVRWIEGGANKRYIEVLAFDVTDLHAKQELLQEANEAKSQTVKTLRRIQDNIVAIAREEEILAMKMELHNEFGYHLQAIRHFYMQGCPSEAKEDFLAGQREILKKLRGELGGDDKVDSFAELTRLAKALDMQITVTGELPGQTETREILAEVLRECLTNTIRHASGDHVFLDLAYGEKELSACVKNNGRPPEREIAESGGLSSLRKRVESYGGTMSVRSLPEFQLNIQLPIKGGEL